MLWAHSKTEYRRQNTENRAQKTEKSDIRFLTSDFWHLSSCFVPVSNNFNKTTDNNSTSHYILPISAQDIFFTAWDYLLPSKKPILAVNWNVKIFSLRSTKFSLQLRTPHTNTSSIEKQKKFARWRTQNLQMSDCANTKSTLFVPHYPLSCQ